MEKCPKCYSTERQNKAGRTQAGSQRYRCLVCGAKYTPVKKPQGYGTKVRKQAIRLYVDGMNLRRTARHLGVHHTTVAVWVKEYVSQLPKAPQPRQVKTAEMDELFTFIGSKKTKST
jgi:transposase-like protein